MANKKFEEFVYRDFIGEAISQGEFEEMMLEVLEEEERYSLEEYLDMLELSQTALQAYLSEIREQYPQLFSFGKERFYLCRELGKEKKVCDIHLISLLLCDDGILAEVDMLNEENIRSFAKYVFDVKRVETELEERRAIHQKWKRLLQELYAYDDRLPVDCEAIIDHEEILNVYREVFPQNKIGSYLVQNLEALAVTASTPPFLAIAPLYIYQMLTKHISRLNKNEGLQVKQSSLWKYQQYQIDFDNGKNFKANVRNIQLFLGLCEVFAEYPEVDLKLCQYGFIQLSNLYAFYEANFPEETVFAVDSLEEWILTHPFSCYSGGHEDAVMYRKSGISYLKYRRFRRSSANKESLEHIFCHIVEREKSLYSVFWKRMNRQYLHCVRKLLAKYL